MEEDLIIEVWDTFREYVSDKNKEVAANQYIDFLIGKDVELLMGYDSYLDNAIQLVVDENKDDEDEIDEEDYDYGEDLD